MNSEDIYEGITNIRDDQIDKAGNVPKRKKSRRLWWMAPVAAMLCVVLVVAAMSGLQKNSGTSSVIAAAEYPEQVQYSEENLDAWYADQKVRREYSYTYVRDKMLDRFMNTAVPKLLSGSGEENRVCSPLNVYMALSMLTELTDGDSQKQILDLLDCSGIEEVRSRANAVWNANYINDGTVTSLLANSVWLNENIDFVQKTMDTLAGNYYTSSYQGEMGSEVYNQALRDWINENTGGRLNDQSAELELKPATLLALISTVYYRAKWSYEFIEANTSPDVFHAPGKDETVDFMHQTVESSYDRGRQFSAVTKGLQNSGGMCFILPDEGVSIEELLSDDEVMEYLLSRGWWENSKYAKINLSIPKFDVESDLDMIGSLKELGVTNVFDVNAADFSPMISEPSKWKPYLSRAEHAARVTIDENGCEAASYVLMELMDGAGEEKEEPEEIDFILDRPFLFAITGEDTSLLFVGIVNQP